MSRLCVPVRLVAYAVLSCCAFPVCGSAAEPAPAPHPIYPRFDLTYLPEIGEQGLIGFRPVEMARYIERQEQEGLNQMFLTMFSLVVRDADLDAAEPPDFANIEQCVFSLQLHVTAPKGNERGTLMLGGTTPCVIRTVRPFDWDNLAIKWFPKAVRKKHADCSYLQIQIRIPDAMDEMSKGTTFGVYIPDDRTLVCGDEEEIIALLDRVAARKPAPVTPPGWSEVDRDFAALVLDVREEQPVTGRFPADYPWGKDLYKLVNSSQTLALGLSVGDRTELRLVGASKDAASARVAVRSMQLLFKAAKKRLIKEENDFLKAFTMELLDSLVVESDGSQFTASANADRNILELMLTILHGQD